MVTVPQRRATGPADPPAAVPGRLQTRTAPAAGEHEPGAVREVDGHLGGRVAGVPAPARVEGLAGNGDRLRADQLAGQIELVDGHVAEQRVRHLLAEAAEVRRLEEAALDEPQRAQPG